jgi:hypothetical protein
VEHYIFATSLLPHFGSRRTNAVIEEKENTVDDDARCIFTGVETVTICAGECRAEE